MMQIVHEAGNYKLIIKKDIHTHHYEIVTRRLSNGFITTYLFIEPKINLRIINRLPVNGDRFNLGGLNLTIDREYKNLYVQKSESLTVG